MSTYNLASKFVAKVDERFRAKSIVSQITNRDFDWNGVQSITIWNVPTVPMVDYNRYGVASHPNGGDGLHRYGNPSELENGIQTMTIRKDRAWTFTIDKLNKKQTQMIMDAGKAVSRQLNEVVIPEVDLYTITEIAKAALAANIDSTTVTKANAHSLILKAQSALGNANVPDDGRVLVCSYEFLALIKQDPSFVQASDTAQRMMFSGEVGRIDGLRVIVRPSAQLPGTTGAGGRKMDFLVTHPIATVAPMILREYKIHTDAPGISGWLCEGRIVYDAFVLNNKKAAIYYQGPALS